EHVGAVCRRDQDHDFMGLEAIYLDQQLVQRLLTLVVAATQARTAMPADRIDFVDEDDARSILLRLLEHVAYARGADANEHFDEIGTGDREERNIGFARNGACYQRLAGTGRADQQHAARNASAKSLEFAGIAQEFDDLLEVLLGFIDTGNILERNTAMCFGQHLRA